VQLRRAKVRATEAIANVRLVVRKAFGDGKALRAGYMSEKSRAGV
jgi:hypothetical protein